jgi:hypothetical protein
VGQFEESRPETVHRFAAADPEMNCLKTGTTADLPRLPEDTLAVNSRTLQWYAALTPQNLFHCWMVDHVSITSAQIERQNRMERRGRDRVVLRSRLFWDDDRRRDAEILGERLASAPALVVNELRRTPQGCDWMIGRWARLARVADLDPRKSWDRAQQALAFDLLGARPEDRLGEIGEVIDHEGRVVSSPIEHAELARREVASLLVRKEEVAGLDTLDRAMVEADYVDAPTPEIRQIHRRTAELHRRLKWYLEQLRAKPAYPYTKPAVYDYFLSKMGSAPAAAEVPAAASVPTEAATTEPAPVPRLQLDPAEFDENGNTWQYLINARRDEQDRKDQAREEARYARRQRRRLGA